MGYPVLNINLINHSVPDRLTAHTYGGRSILRIVNCTSSDAGLYTLLISDGDFSSMHSTMVNIIASGKKGITMHHRKYTPIFEI